MINKIQLEDLNQNYENLIFEKQQQTVFSSKTFLTYHMEKYKTQVLVFSIKNEPVAYLPYVEKDNKFISHPGSTYGGIVQVKRLEEKSLNELVKQFHSFLKQESICFYEFRLPPRIFIKDSINQLNDTIANLCKLNYPEEETFISLKNKNFEELNNCQFTKGHKSEIKWFLNNNQDFKLEKLSNDYNLEQFYSILKSNMKKFNKQPTHNLQELKYLIKKLPQKVIITSLIREKLILASVMNFILNDKTVHTFYSSFNYSSKNSKGALKYLYWKLINEYSFKNYEYFNFGIDESFGEVKNDSLRYFKNGFGGQQLSRIKYVLTI